MLILYLKFHHQDEYGSRYTQGTTNIHTATYKKWDGMGYFAEMPEKYR